jgi:hypothetical protein
MKAKQSLTKSTILARVGDAPITREAFTYQQAIEQLYRGGETTAEVTTLVSSFYDALQREVARLNDVSATPEDIETTSRHAEQSSHSLELLAQIKAVFGEDREAYHRIFLEPKIIPNKLRELFSQIPRHSEVLQKIEQARKEIVAGSDLSKAAQKHHLTFRELTLQEPDATLQEQPHRPIELSENPLLQVAKSLETGEVHEDIVETGQEYLIVRLRQREASNYLLEIVSAEKPAFEDWFREQAANIVIVVEDAALFKQIREQYAQVWWLADVKGPGAEA